MRVQGVWGVLGVCFGVCVSGCVFWECVFWECVFWECVFWECVFWRGGVLEERCFGGGVCSGGVFRVFRGFKVFTAFGVYGV